MIDVVFIAGVGAATLLVFISIYYVIKKTLIAKCLKEKQH